MLKSPNYIYFAIEVNHKGGIWLHKLSTFVVVCSLMVVQPHDRTLWVKVAHIVAVCVHHIVTPKLCWECSVLTIKDYCNLTAIL